MFGIMFHIIQERMFCLTRTYVFCLFALIYVNSQIIKRECQVEEKEHFRYLLFDFNQGSHVAKAVGEICIVYGGGNLDEEPLVVGMPSSKMKFLTSETHLILTIQLLQQNQMVKVEFFV
ncbi:hypothetical protein NPIL_305851 [Nephila pilipes]|uniref:Uncharacterized protein n=1 Tax=Nephila pilipes TaxID=299642 RepID=A0A8X6PBC9_NEPPI|nr:hypothetical protein NPIL_305851 [Nephila pilipes]